MKVCCICHIDKPLEAFYPAQNKAHKVTSWCKECHSARRKAQYQAEKASGISRKRAYAWRSRNPERSKAINKRWRERHKDEIRQRVVASKRALKVKVLSHYGPGGVFQCNWPECKITDYDMLTLDHVNNDGYAHRIRQAGRHDWGGQSLYSNLNRQGFPEGYQTLCMNHQFKKHAMFRLEKHDKTLQR